MAEYIRARTGLQIDVVQKVPVRLSEAMDRYPVHSRFDLEAHFPTGVNSGSVRCNSLALAVGRAMGCWAAVARIAALVVAKKLPNTYSTWEEAA